MLVVEKIKTSRQLQILLAEDEHIYQRIIENYIRNLDMQLTIVDNGKKCLDQIEKNNYDIILMDIIMPELDGIETTQAIREKGIKTPIIAVTSNVWKEDEERSIKSGMNDFLPKPFNAQKLFRKIAYWSRHNPKSA